MLTRCLGFIFILSIVFYSCKKEDVATIKDPEEPENTVVYNVSKNVILQLVNDVRLAGCNCGSTTMPPVNALTWNDQLGKAAYDHSLDMKNNGYFSHTGLNGSNPGQRIKAAGYNWTTYGENIANGYTTEQVVVNGWLKSEGHCKNIMGKNFKHMGVGRSGNYWTQVLGSK